MKKILLYKDEGVSLRSLKFLVHELREENLHQQYDIAFTDRQQLLRTDWMESTELLIFPGGRDVPYHLALQGKANAHIVRFVEQGGKYLGICAGSYYGCARIEFEKGNPLQVCQERELKFFQGMASGPAYGPGKFTYESERGAQLACLTWQTPEKQKSMIYYNGGCAFVDADAYSNVRVIARYDDIERRPAAIISCIVGKGSALLCGVHPEYSGKLPTKDPFLAALLPELQSAEMQRKALLQHLLQLLNVYTETT